jgi:hypothetical protein
MWCESEIIRVVNGNSEGGSTWLVSRVIGNLGNRTDPSLIDNQISFLWEPDFLSI